MHLLDDGGTDQKCHDKDPVKAAAALQRREDLMNLCARMGVQYGTRAGMNTPNPAISTRLTSGRPRS
ncbi:MAG: hypothetical protein R3F31_07135 [Verrucomicrobiales bacterium]